MSLDVYLNQPGETHSYEGRIFIREDGRTVELSREEWDKRFPDREPAMVSVQDTNEVFSANITHNLNEMADLAGVYQHLWRPEELGITKAKQLIEPLRAGLVVLQNDPEQFKKLNPSNGWGSYEGLVAFVAAYVSACEEYPEADVSVSR